MDQMKYRIQLSYSSVDRLFFVRLFEHEIEIKEKSFATEEEARNFIESVKG